MSTYPNSFDDNVSLPPATGDDAVSINSNIEATQAIESALGLLPAGIYASVRTRLDILEARIGNPFAPSPNVLNPFFIGNTGVTITAGFGIPNFSAAPGSIYLREDGYVPQSVYSFTPDGVWHPVGSSGSGNFTADGDLSGTSVNQTVIGLQNRPINPDATLLQTDSEGDGYVLTWNATGGVSGSPGFGILAGSGITNTGPSTVTGDVGSFPTPAETGFGTLTIIGTNHHGDSVTQAGKVALTAQYLAAQGLAPTATIPTDLNGQTLSPGVYHAASGTFSNSGTLTLDGGGNPNATWTFQMDSTLVTASSSTVILINGAQAKNIFWAVGSSATLGTSSHLEGSILALTSITMTTGATINGAVLAQNGAVTLDTNTIVATSGVLGTGWWEPQIGFFAAGDLAGNKHSQTVVKIDGYSVPAGGSIGNVLQISGVGALSYNPVNLAGGANFVTGSLPTTNQVAQSLTLTNDVTSSGGTTTSASTIVAQITGSGGQIPINAKIVLQDTTFNDGYNSAQTTDGSTVTIYTDSAIPSGTCYDFIVTVVGINTAMPNPPDVYRANFAFTYVNRSGTLFAVGATAVPLNVRTLGAGNTWGGASISTLGTSIIVQVAGLSSTTIDWSCSFSRMKVS